jgi:CHASE1-domain containing sensor protein
MVILFQIQLVQINVLGIVVILIVKTHKRTTAVSFCDSGEKAKLMIKSIQDYTVYAWNFLFNHEISPVRNIPDVALQHYVLQVLGLMWAISFSLAIGSYTFLAVSLIGHTVLIAAAAITVATLTTAAKKPEVFIRLSGRRNDGEHE